MVFQVYSMGDDGLPEKICEKCFRFYLKNSLGKDVCEFGIRISTLEELMNFIELAGGSVFLGNSWIDGKTPSIGIQN